MKTFLLLFLSILLFVPSVLAHGTVISPPSRVWNCYRENPENPSSAACISAVASHGTQPLYDWNEINQANADGNHSQFVPDGKLASGGRQKYGGMDQVRSDWVATPVTAGPTAIIWKNTAPHATAYYDVYITKESWQPDQALHWDDLELLVRTAPSPAESEVSIPVTLPPRVGRHVIYSLWQRSDSPEAFYSTSDVDFGGGTTSVHPEASLYFELEQCFPNPFKSACKIMYQLKKSESVSLRVFDVAGQEVAILVNEFQTPGTYDLEFDGSNLPGGIYFYRLQVGDMLETKRMILEK
ncbi:MAG: lytic polysaccharide monooxygenase [Bacteroidia bacterium]|nr:lytic polysaccharide monooxygenase [Bacteroidia bacterium]